jgi:hypothetical protein
MSCRFILLIIAAGALTFSTPALGQQRSDDGRVRLRSSSSRVHVPGVRWEVGAGGHVPGLGYMYAWERAYTWWEFGLTFRAGVGADVKAAFAGELDSFEALMGHGVLRLSALSEQGGITLELAPGIASEPLLIPLAQAGIYLAFANVEVGYAYTTPVLADRPAWLNDHQLSLRLHLPIARH